MSESAKSEGIFPQCQCTTELQLDKHHLMNMNIFPCLAPTEYQRSNKLKTVKQLSMHKSNEQFCCAKISKLYQTPLTQDKQRRGRDHML